MFKFGNFKFRYIFMNMKTTILTLATAIALTSCGGAATETTTVVDSTKTVVMVNTDSVKTDSLAPAKADSLKK